jgi:hypothetical protein
LFFRWGLPTPSFQSSFFCLTSSWGHRCIPPHQTCLLRWGLTNFLLGLASNGNGPICTS